MQVIQKHLVKAGMFLQLPIVPVLDGTEKDALMEHMFDKSVWDSKYRIQTWTVSQSRHISQLRRASLVTVTKELICVKWSKAHIWAR